jgi:hypothetical protein
MKKLINVATVKERIDNGQKFTATAVPFDAVPGHLLNLKVGHEEYVLSTWRSDVPRHFKRADALLKEAKSLGLTNITFELDSDN